MQNCELGDSHGRHAACWCKGSTGSSDLHISSDSTATASVNIRCDGALGSPIESAARPLDDMPRSPITRSSSLLQRRALRQQSEEATHKRITGAVPFVSSMPVAEGAIGAIGSTGTATTGTGTHEHEEERFELEPVLGLVIILGPELELSEPEASEKFASEPLPLPLPLAPPLPLPTGDSIGSIEDRPDPDPDSALLLPALLVLAALLLRLIALGADAAAVSAPGLLQQPPHRDWAMSVSVSPCVSTTTRRRRPPSLRQSAMRCAVSATLAPAKPLAAAKAAASPRLHCQTPRLRTAARRASAP